MYYVLLIILPLASHTVCIPLISSNLARSWKRCIGGSAAVVHLVKVPAYVTIIGTFAPILLHNEASCRGCVIRFSIDTSFSIAHIEPVTSGRRSTAVRTLLRGMKGTTIKPGQTGKDVIDAATMVKMSVPAR